VEGGVVLNALVDKSLSKLQQIIDFPLDKADPEFMKLLSAQKDASVALLNTAVKVDETRLRARTENSLTKLLEKINQRRLTA
jgi:hypothetical protein